MARPTPTAALTDQLGQSRTDAAALSEYSTAAELRQRRRARSPPWDWGVPPSQIRHPKNTYVSNRINNVPQATEVTVTSVPRHVPALATNRERWALRRRFSPSPLLSACARLPCSRVPAAVSLRTSSVSTLHRSLASPVPSTPCRQPHG